MDFLSNDLEFPHFNSIEPCMFCPISRSLESTCPITDMSINAEWKGRLMPIAMGCVIPPTAHPIMSLVGVNRYHASGDLMHSGHLGQDSFVVGGVLHELLFDGPFPGSKAQRLEQIWEKIQFWYDRLASSTRLTTLKETMFVNKDDFSVLSCKAAETNQLLIVMVELCKEVDSGSARDKHRIIALESLAAVYKIFKDAGMFLTHDEHTQAVEAYDTHMLHYNWLLKRALRMGARNYPITIKTHAMWHIVDFSKWLNPRWVWCYEFEDWAGAMTTCAKACVAGSPMELIGVKVLQNYLLVLQLSLTMRGKRGAARGSM